ncbi:AhpC/TSA family protein [Cytobacillus oceanisediminis]|jgi:peroxiredoxin (alkyl hydroperoxide reductase subunit C)|uniref:AhpC/TSA family protein n=2 Tax=Cytobacillus oceanisediminis TaxID=665099 RepID=A0A2V2ZN97_9BACI|nr:AhpC/TSA family protein [Cytobacillus oceanisediminis]
MVNEFNAAVAASPAFFCASRGDRAPIFTADAIIDNQIKKINLENYKGKWVLLFFYPSDFTFV